MWPFLNFSKPEGQEVLHRLTDKADIFLTNLPRMASLQKYNMDYNSLSARNPRIIYGSITGYGHTGPRAGQAGYDLAAQGESGTMYLTGEPNGGPMRFPTPIADMTTGMFTLIGILSALHARHASGKGQFIDVSLLESQMTWLENYAGEYFATGQNPPRRGSSHPQVVPYEPVEASDGVWFILGVGSDNLWQKFCELANLGALQDAPRFHTNSERVTNREDLMPHVREVIQTRTAAEWIDTLQAAGIPCGPIRDMDTALKDPHVAARNFIVELEHPTLGMLKSLATPIHMSETTTSYRRYPPRLGEHNDELLAEFGYSDVEIAGLKENGVV